MSKEPKKFICMKMYEKKIKREHERLMSSANCLNALFFTFYSEQAVFIYFRSYRILMRVLTTFNPLLYL